jgi:hypothetical protein
LNKEQAVMRTILQARIEVTGNANNAHFDLPSAMRVLCSAYAEAYYQLRRAAIEYRTAGDQCSLGPLNWALYREGKMVCPFCDESISPDEYEGGQSIDGSEPFLVRRLILMCPARHRITVRFEHSKGDMTLYAEADAENAVGGDDSRPPDHCCAAS